MRKFEYKTLKIRVKGSVFSSVKPQSPSEIDKLLNSWGSDGWELVNTEQFSWRERSAEDLFFFLKREIWKVD